MARLPIDAADTNVWGQLLNEYLLVSHLDDGAVKVVPANLGSPLTSGEASFDRKFIGQPGAGASGEVLLTYFTACKTETITQVAMYSVTAAATATLIRYGVYSVAGNGDLALITGTVNDLTVFASTNTRYVRTLAAPWNKVAGTRYAVGHLVVATTPPSVYGSTDATAGTVLDAVWAIEPRMSGVRTGQSDLPASITSANVVANRRGPYFELIP
jgi:hypothetical protein